MTVSPAWDLQTAVWSALTADTALTTALGGSYIYDDVPQDADFPFVTIGEIRTNDWSTQTAKGHEHFLTVHAWSRAKGRKESRAFYGLYGSYVYAEDIALNGHVSHAGQFRYGTVAYVRNMTVDAGLGATEKTFFADYNSHITEFGTNSNATFNPSVASSGNKSSSVV